MKITHWVASYDAPRWPVVDSWMNVQTPDNARLNFVRSTQPHNKDLAEWNKVIVDFLARGDDWLFITAQDVIFCKEALMRLMSWDKKIISALVFMRNPPNIPHIWKAYSDGGANIFVNRINDTRQWLMNHANWMAVFGSFAMEPKPDDALVPVDFTSTSCTLIHRSVLEALEPPYFLMDSDEGGGEDRRLFQNALAKGFQPYVDRSCIVGHLMGDVPASAPDFITWTEVSVLKNTGQKEETQDTTTS